MAATAVARKTGTVAATVAAAAAGGDGGGGGGHGGGDNTKRTSKRAQEKPQHSDDMDRHSGGATLATPETLWPSSKASACQADGISLRGVESRGCSIILTLLAEHKRAGPKRQRGDLNHCGQSPMDF